MRIDLVISNVGNLKQSLNEDVEPTLLMCLMVQGQVISFWWMKLRVWYRLRLCGNKGAC